MEMFSKKLGSKTLELNTGSGRKNPHLECNS